MNDVRVPRSLLLLGAFCLTLSFLALVDRVTAAGPGVTTLDATPHFVVLAPR